MSTIEYTQGALSGEKLKGTFSYVEDSIINIRAEIISDIVLKGHHNGSILYIIRNAFTSDIAEKLINAFDKELAKTEGGNRPYDGFVKTSQIGATQFSKNGKAYVEDVADKNRNLISVFDSLQDTEVEKIFLSKFLENLFLEEGKHFGPARYKAGHSSFITLRRWLDNGEMSLWPHDDTAQLRVAAQDDFEIAHSIQQVISFNAVVEAAKGGGFLKVWNYKPDAAARSYLGLEETGYPYPIELFTNSESVEVRLQQGDIYFLNASFLHGVTSVSAGRRFSAGRFIGVINNQKVVYWT